MLTDFVVFPEGKRDGSRGVGALLVVRNRSVLVFYRRIAESRLAETRTDGKRLGTHASSVLGVGQ
jgi:hypothetical protein